MKYFMNCFWLILPVLIWNMIFSGKLPEIFRNNEKNIPGIIKFCENIFRAIVLILPAFMILSLSANIQKIGMLIYILGILIYFMSWLVLIVFPKSAWSKSKAGILAPAYTPAIWLTGIGLIGGTLYLNIPYERWYYFIAAAAFIIFHNIDTCIKTNGKTGRSKTPACY